METRFKGKIVQLKAKLPKVGYVAPNFKFVKTDLQEATLSQTMGKKTLIISAPSLDTGVCALEAKRFSAELAKMPEVIAIFITRDLPFAMARFCAAEGIQNIIPASDFRYHQFGDKYGAEMQTGPLKALLARAIWVLDANQNIIYMELVPEITTEPNYANILTALK
jgi:thiol peroxidase